MKTEFNVEYWDNLFSENKIGWDIGYVSPPIKEYFDQVKDKNLKILIPGAGNAYEAEYLHKNDFSNVYVLDFSEKAIKSFKKRCPDFPANKIIKQDFFSFNQTFDLIIEQTFFTSFHPSKRSVFVKKIHSLLNNNGKYLGLFFTHEFGKNYPPFGATKETYKQLFGSLFTIKTLKIASNSIKPRREREFFFIFKKIS